MSIAVKIPAMGESINSGVLAKWHVKDGDFVKKDQPLYELETDKITSEGVAEAAGRITLKVEVDSEVKIGAVVAEIDDRAQADDVKDKPDDKPTDISTAKSEDKTAAKPASADKSSEQPLSPAVRRIVAETGIDLASVEGTGKGGRVTKGDLLEATKAAAPDAKPDAAKSAPADAPAPATTSAEASAKEERQTRKKMSPLRTRIAQRLVQAQHEAAMLTTFNEVDMSAVIELRKKYQDDFVKKYGVKLGFMSFFTKAVVHALQQVPAINAQLDGDSVVQNHYYDIGVAVSTDKGLMVPVVRDCDRKGMADIEKEIADAAKRAREGKITLDDLSGGVFTITNGGIFGSMLSTPILNPPQSAILGLHAINERPAAVNGQVVIRPMMYLALSYDHRVVDGREAVTFLVKIKQTIEDPTRLIIGI